jgi:hypothetical protein
MIVPGTHVDSSKHEPCSCDVLEHLDMENSFEPNAVWPIVMLIVGHDGVAGVSDDNSDVASHKMVKCAKEMDLCA